MWPLLASSIIGLALMLDRLVSFAWQHERFSRFIHRLEPVMRAERWEEAARLCSGHGPFSYLAKVYLEQRSAPREVRESVVQREGQIAIHRLERRLRWLAITGSLSPMLGLLGTVTGLVSAFHQIEILGGQIQPSDLAAGIWEALLTTVFGLVIAIPCMGVFHALESRLDRLAMQMSLLTSYLDQWCHLEQPSEKSQREEPAETS
jgi:biopolymer transport protein ExbB